MEPEELRNWRLKNTKQVLIIIGIIVTIILSIVGFALKDKNGEDVNVLAKEYDKLLIEGYYKTQSIEHSTLQNMNQYFQESSNPNFQTPSIKIEIANKIEQANDSLKWMVIHNDSVLAALKHLESLINDKNVSVNDTNYYSVVINENGEKEKRHNFFQRFTHFLKSGIISLFGVKGSEKFGVSIPDSILNSKQRAELVAVCDKVDLILADLKTRNEMTPSDISITVNNGTGISVTASSNTKSQNGNPPAILSPTTNNNQGKSAPKPIEKSKLFRYGMTKEELRDLLSYTEWNGKINFNKKRSTDVDFSFEGNNCSTNYFTREKSWKSAKNESFTYEIDSIRHYNVYLELFKDTVIPVKAPYAKFKINPIGNSSSVEFILFYKNGKEISDPGVRNVFNIKEPS